MIVDKTKLGIDFFDDSFGGVYRGRPVLCSGRKGCGKSVFACHFLNQALQDGDKALLLSNFRAQDTIIVAESLGLPFAEAVTNGQLTILEYTTFIPERSASANVMLPPQSFMELQETVESQSIRRIAFDTVLPWVAIHPIARIAEHVYSFIHAIERLGVTSLLTLPKPVSNPAFTLKSRLEDLCPVVVNIEHTGENRVLRITKYLGAMRNLSTSFPFSIIHGKGLVAENTKPEPGSQQGPPITSPATSPVVAAPDVSPSPEQPKTPIMCSSAATAPDVSPSPAQPRKPIHFSSALAAPEAAPSPAQPRKPIHFSSALAAPEAAPSPEQPKTPINFSAALAALEASPNPAKPKKPIHFSSVILFPD